MKKLVLIMLLIMASVSFAVTPVLGGDIETEAKDEVSDARDAVDEAETAFDGNFSIFQPEFERCPEVKEQWDDASDDLVNAQELYDGAFEDLMLDHFEDAYENAQNSLAASENVINTLDGLPNLVYLCDSNERMQNASAVMTNLTKARNEAEPVVEPKLACPEVEDKWEDAEGQYTLANTHFTGGDYLDAKQTALNAISLYEEAVALAENCTPPQPEQASDTGCNSDINCASSQKCVEGECVNVACECGYVSNHVCHEYECCEDSDCASGYECLSHSCSEIVVPEQPVQPVQQEPESTGPAGCTLSTIIILLSLAGVFVGRN